MTKQFVFKVLLVAFSFILIPTTYWHTCEKNHSETNKNGFSIDNEHSICSICDFDCFQLGSPQETKLSYSKSFHQVEEFVLLSNSEIHFKLNFNKGPPRC